MRDDAGRPAARVREGVREVDCGLVLDQRLHKTEAGQRSERPTMVTAEGYGIPGLMASWG